MIFCTFCGSLLFSFPELYQMHFCNQSRPEQDFFVWSCSHLGCADLCQVTLLCLWIICSILSFPLGTIRGLLAGIKSLPLFMLLIFSTSSVGKLWVNKCLWRFLCWVLFGSMWSFLWSSIRARIIFLVVVCREWRWIIFNQISCFPSWPGVFQLNISLVWF